jgi:hypothetical protein
MTLSCAEASSPTMTAGPHTPGVRSMASIGATVSEHSITSTSGSVVSCPVALATSHA